MTTSLWKGLIEVLFENCSNPEEIPEKNITLREKLFLLEKCTNLSQIYGNFTAFFTNEDVNYLNSDLLHEINNSIREKSPLATACKKNFVNAVRFYVQRMESKCINYCILYLSSSVEIFEILLSKKPTFSKLFPDLFSISVKLNRIEIVKYLYENKLFQPVRRQELLEMCVINNYIEMFEFLHEKTEIPLNKFSKYVSTMEFVKYFESKGIVYDCEDLADIIQSNTANVKLEVIKYFYTKEPTVGFTRDDAEMMVDHIVKHNRIDLLEIHGAYDETMRDCISIELVKMLSILNRTLDLSPLSLSRKRELLLYATQDQARKNLLKYLLRNKLVLDGESRCKFFEKYNTENILEIISEFPEMFICLVKNTAPNIPHIETPIILQRLLEISADTL